MNKPRTSAKSPPRTGAFSSPIGWVDGGEDPRFADALTRAIGGEEPFADCVHLEREDRRAVLGAAGTESTRSVGNRQVLVSFPVGPTTGDVICGFEILATLRKVPETTEEMEALVKAGYGRKDDKRVMITLSGGPAAPAAFGQRAAATEVLLDWTEWASSPARGLNRFVPFDREGNPVWFPTCGMTLGNAKFHLLVSEALADKTDFHLVVRTLLSDGLRRATEKGKRWKLPNGRELLYNAHAEPGRHFRVE